MGLGVSRSERPDSEFRVRTLQNCPRHWSPFPGSQRAVETNPGLHPILQVNGIWAQTAPRDSRQSAHRLQLESSVYSGPKKRSDGQVAAWALPAPNTDAPPTRLGRPPLSGALTATAAWLGPPVSGGGGVATARHPTWPTSRSRSGKEVVNARSSGTLP